MSSDLAASSSVLVATIEVVDEHEKLLGSGRFTTDPVGHAAMRQYSGA
jgi:hypothetical protein